MLVRLKTRLRTGPRGKHRRYTRYALRHVFQLAADFSQRFRVVETHFRSKPVAPTSRPRSAFCRDSCACDQSPSLRQPISSEWSDGRSTSEFFEVEARNFGDHVVDDGSKEAGVRPPVMSFISSSRCNPPPVSPPLWQSGNQWLSTQRRRTRHARVHFDNNQATVFGFTANWTLEPPVSTPISRSPPSRRYA